MMLINAILVGEEAGDVLVVSAGTSEQGRLGEVL